MKPSRPLFAVAAAGALAAAAAAFASGTGSEGHGEPSASVPAFQVDPEWPRGLPDGWTMSSVLGLHVDDRDHVWVSHRAELLTPEDLEGAGPGGGPGRAAPLVLFFDPEGNVVRGWDHEAEADRWPPVLHGFFVDHRGYLWSTARDQHQIMKFTPEGELVLTIGEYGETGGSNDPERLGRPSDVYVPPGTNELFVVDGYVNRRVVVFDTETGAYLRHWGAYGEPPDDEAPATREPDGPPPPQFNTVHGITGSRDGLIYVADRTNSRVQVFERSGAFVTERVLRPGAGAAFAVALSHDPEERFLYVADGTEHKVWILRRDDLEIVGELGREGSAPGEFGRPHNLGVDSRGNLYVGEADPGWRVQRFLLQDPETP